MSKAKSGQAQDLFGDAEQAKAKSAEMKSAETKSADMKSADLKSGEKASARSAARALASAEAGYGAKDIEVLEGLEPVRRRPGMYIGGTDEKALHHLFAEVIDNSMDEAVAGHASWIEVELDADGFLTVTDNGRGIPVDPHPKFPGKSALEVIMTTLHSGGKFDCQGLRDLGRPARRRRLGGQRAVRARSRSRSRATGSSTARASRAACRWARSRSSAEVHNRRGTTHPLPARPGDLRQGRGLQAGARCSGWRARRPICSAASRSAGAATRRCSQGVEDVPAKATFHFPGGLQDYPGRRARGRGARHRRDLRRQDRERRRPRRGRMGGRLVRRRRRLRPLLLQHHPDARRRHARGRPAHGADPRPEGPMPSCTGNKRAAPITADDVMAGRAAMLVGVHPRAGIPGPDQGQAGHRRGRRASSRTRCATPSTTGSPATPQPGRQAARLGDRARRGAAAPPPGEGDRAQDRRRASCACPASSPTARRRARRTAPRLFIVEGDSAGGSAKQARDRADPGDPAAARQDPQRRQRRPRQARPEPGARRPDPGARLRHRRRTIATRTCATSGSSS